MENASDESRMGAMIACVLHVNPDTLTDEEFYKAWGRVKYYTSLVHQVKWG